MTAKVPFAHAFAMERAVRTFLAVQGVPTIPCNEFSGRNEAHQQAPTTFIFNEKTGRVERMVLPDLIRLPSFHAMEIKTQGYAPMMASAGVSTTGILRRHYAHYRDYEKRTGRSVELVFVHLVEDAIVGGVLDEIEPAKTRAVNPLNWHDLFYWEFARLPRWPVSLSQLLNVALRYGRSLGREGYSHEDHAEVLDYLNTVARPNYERHSANFGRPTIPTPEPSPVVVDDMPF